MKALSFFAIAVIAGVPLLSYAATYYYVDTSGDVAAIEATNATAAIDASTGDRAMHSGVSVDQGFLEEGADADTVVLGTGGPENQNTYWYVDVSGDLATVVAPSAAVALDLTVTMRHANSGVALVE